MLVRFIILQSNYPSIFFFFLLLLSCVVVRNITEVVENMILSFRESSFYRCWLSIALKGKKFSTTHECRTLVRFVILESYYPFVFFFSLLLLTYVTVRIITEVVENTILSFKESCLNIGTCDVPLEDESNLTYSKRMANSAVTFLEMLILFNVGKIALQKKVILFHRCS